MTADRAAQATFRQDIQGLRAIAVLLVLVYHLWPDVVRGGYVGVDIFFVISGFLITGHLLEHPPRRARDVAEFWGRRARRLLPAAFLVLAATLVGARLLAPETQWPGVAQGVIASALYVQNWALAANAVDYLAATNAPTATQHYWSLSVEEQFYLFWPVLILAVAWLAGRAGIGIQATARVAMAIVVGISIAISVSATASEPASAYFITPTRVWELGIGGVIATLPSLGTLQLQARHVDRLAWLGLGLLLLAGFVFTNDTPFPGTAALLPVVGAALFISAGAVGPWSPTRILGRRPIQHIGDTSYSIYLWHWPLIVLAPYLVGAIGPVVAVSIIALTLILATLTKAFVEDPYRFSPRLQALRPTFRFAGVGMALVVALAGAQLVEVQLRTNTAVAQVANVAEASGSCFGAAAIVRGTAACPPDPRGPMVPEPALAANDRPDAYRDECWVDFPFTDRTTCTYGSGPLRVALVGNSHAGQWLPTLQVLAEEHGWTLTTYVSLQCNVTAAELAFNTPEKIAGCLDYGRWVMDQTTADPFDLIITTERQSVPTNGDTIETTMARAIEGYAGYLTRWQATGAKVVVLEDTPYPWQVKRSIPDCLAQHPDERDICNGTPAAWYSIDPLYDAARRLQSPAITTVPTRAWFCTANVCPAVIGNVIVYFDGSHMTATYARTLAPELWRPIEAALGAASGSPAP